jgi:pyrimidine deaminase RibD-like protein
MTSPSKSEHLFYLQQALDLARKSPPNPRNFCVGALLVSYPLNNTPEVLSTGYTLELPGNTHAEQCALSKLASSYSISESGLKSILAPEMNVILYTTLEPCSRRLSGNTPCIQRIIATRDSGSGGMGGIRKVIFGVKEPGTFVRDSESCRMMTEANMDWEYVDGLQDEILTVSRSGHAKQARNLDAISEIERWRQEAIPENPKKRTTELCTPPGSGT